MTEQQVPVKKNRLAADLAWAAVILAAVGLFLGWRASNMEQTSVIGALFLVFAALLLIGALVTRQVLKR